VLLTRRLNAAEDAGFALAHTGLGCGPAGR
jgi:hypothetical protein